MSPISFPITDYVPPIDLADAPDLPSTWWHLFEATARNPRAQRAAEFARLKLLLHGFEVRLADSDGAGAGG